MNPGHLPLPPPAVPQSPQTPFRRFIAWLLARFGWRLVGEFPNIPKVVFIAAPHSSWWDGVLGLMFKVAVGLDASFMAKRELFWGPLGWLLRRLGGIPIERSTSHGVVEQMVERFQTRERLWLGIAPEGTRQSVRKWKSGFWHIAHDAGVPVWTIYFHYPEKTVGLGPVFELTDDAAADIARIREFYRPWQGKHRGA
ncbi:lysophospholipid acyltransferase family protein [Tahibacter amnicola]|uniref:Lysophospholipid acyltransferase family protein n=1 Tax=Tahibacter amnicola TaxID=2976241 RepID=A0ABY6BED0_9GAMM|nr:lysophospholipid acyltransferase family protein [Tahibacter amnicola]UXI68388.1 lysophospholipid acyltransferase family protein [Tahibacter amnicola]